MANGGWYGTDEEWRSAEAPLPELDALIAEFGNAHGFAISKNAKDWPDRSLRKPMPLESMLQIFRAELETDAWKVWAVCSEDRGDRRYWKQELIANGVTSDELKKSLAGFLERGLQRLIEWNAKPDQLEFATMLGRR